MAQTTGRVISETGFAEVMHLVDEQQEWNRRTRDLIARARPCPLPVNDSVPSVMIPQWHRGTTWARDAARAFHDEVAERVSAGVSVCPRTGQAHARGSYFTTRALEAAGIPVLELHADNVDARSADGDALTRTVGDWLDRHVLAGG
ncbi:MULTISPECIES: 2-hydroxyacyl-CoA dehydratase family protein [unclassified Streptomyces]|uniref:2-hydroxyacyl-CoA dehydratase family protein n=1 Tax=unclassified Streptomyces TaxID=2593676 RepID=UPI002D21D42F|nr:MULTISPECIES: 2-hydroxyacyl-CoA dehydratase family protein [unclassified Streptomyces]